MTNKPLIITDGRIEQIDEVDALPQYSHLKTGWEYEALLDGQVNITINVANRTLTLTPTGNEISYWIKGVEYTVNTTQNITWNDSEGMWYLKMTANGPDATQVQWEFDDSAAFVSSLYWDATNKSAILWAPEFHSWIMSQPLEEFIHETFGVRWASGLGCEINTGNTTINTANGVLWDQDQKFTITNNAGSGYHDQILTPLTSPILYRTGASGVWRKIAASSNLCYVDTTVPQVNTWNGTEWVWTPVDVNRFFAYWAVGSTAINEAVYLIPGQVDSATLADAVVDNTWSDLSFGELPTQEHKVIARLILQRQAGSPYYTITQLDDYRNIADEPNNAGGSGSGTSDHGSLTGLGDDDHTQYSLVDGTRAFTGTITTPGVTSTGNLTLNSANLIAVEKPLSIGSNNILANSVEITHTSVNDTFVVNTGNNTINALSSSIISGRDNTISGNVDNSGIFTGCGNTLNGYGSSAILAGIQNISSGAGCVILGGANNNALGHYGITHGRHAVNDFWCGQARASGSLDEVGDVQYMTVTQFIRSTSNTAVDMTTDGVDSGNSLHKLVMPPNCMWQMTGYVAGFINFANIGAHYYFHAAIRRDGTDAPAYVSGSPSISVLGEDHAEYNCALAIRAGNVIAIVVTGTADVAVPRLYNWVARLQILQIKVQD